MNSAFAVVAGVGLEADVHVSILYTQRVILFFFAISHVISNAFLIDASHS